MMSKRFGIKTSVGGGEVLICACFSVRKDFGYVANGF